MSESGDTPHIVRPGATPREVLVACRHLVASGRPVSHEATTEILDRAADTIEVLQGALDDIKLDMERLRTAVREARCAQADAEAEAGRVYAELAARLSE